MESTEIPYISYEECVKTLVKWIKPGKRKPDSVRFVDCAWNLVFRHYSGSFEAAAADVNASPKTMQRLVAIAKLPPEIKQLLKTKQIGIDIASEIAQIVNPKRQIEIAKTLVRVDVKSARRIIRLVKKYPHISPKFFKQRLLELKRKAEHMREIVLLLDEAEFVKLKRESRKVQMEIDELCLRIILKWLESRGCEKYDF